MANGDAAGNAGMDTLNGTEDRRDGWDEINKTRDYIAERTYDVQPIAAGGTGANTAASARSNLDAVGWADTFTDPNDGKNKIMRLNSAGQLATNDPTAALHAANRRWTEAQIAAIPAPNLSAYLPKTGGTVTGDLLLPNANPATDGYTVAYINSNGRVSRGASSERYKEYIEQIDPADLGDIWPALHRFQMIGGDGTWKTGYIAERLAENTDQQPYVVYAEFAGEQIPESIDFIGLLLAQNAQLHQAVDLLAQRLDALESGS